MEYIQNFSHPKALFIFDLEFIGDVRKLSSCHIWEIAVYCVQTQQWFEAVVDPSPEMLTFPAPPIPEIPQLTRTFLVKAGAVTWDIVFKNMLAWVQTQANGATPIFISHNTFRADKPIMELESRRYHLHMPLHWYFFDSLHYARRMIRNTNGNYSLSGLHEQLFNQKIQNAHRARNDVIACVSILHHLTGNTMQFIGPMYPTYTTALRTIRWIGQKAEELLFAANICCVEDLYMRLQKNARRHYIESKTDYQTSVGMTLGQLLSEKLPVDNIRNIAGVLSNPSRCLYCHTFMEPWDGRPDSPNRLHETSFIGAGGRSGS